MIILYLGLLGLLAFIMGVAVLGLWLRKHPATVNAEKPSRIIHFLFFAGLVTPGLVSVFYPGLTTVFDRTLHQTKPSTLDYVA